MIAWKSILLTQFLYSGPCRPNWEIKHNHVNFIKMLFLLYLPFWMKGCVQVGNYWEKSEITTTRREHTNFVAVEAIQPPHICGHGVW